MENLNTIGRRKTSVARIYMKEGKGTIIINDKEAHDFFPSPLHQYKINQPFNITKTAKKYDVTINVSGGGTTGQVEAIRMAISRALCEEDAAHRPALKAEGLLTRDSRMVERKKPGQKKARKKFQFSKR